MNERQLDVYDNPTGSSFNNGLIGDILGTKIIKNVEQMVCGEKELQIEDKILQEKSMIDKIGEMNSTAHMVDHVFQNNMNSICDNLVVLMPQTTWVLLLNRRRTVQLSC